MTQLMLTSWDTLSDLIMIGLCGIIVLFLVYNRIKYRKLILSAPRPDSAIEFRKEVEAHMIHQRFENALTAILTTLESERQALHKFIEDGDIAVAATPVDEKMNTDSEMPGPSAVHPSEIALAQVRTESEQAAQMAACGKNIDEICNDLMLPRECVELIVSMNSVSDPHRSTWEREGVAGGGMQSPTEPEKIA